jgi:hypothetical protein
MNSSFTNKSFVVMAKHFTEIYLKPILHQFHLTYIDNFINEIFFLINKQVYSLWQTNFLPRMISITYYHSLSLATLT